jgi:NHL repeat
MSAKYLQGRFALLLAICASVIVFGVASAQAAPVKLVPVEHIQNEFRFPESVAVAPKGNVYVVDRGHSRIQELTPNGVFVLMFGWDVNKTKVEANASQAEKNVCTAISGDKCQAGVAGTAAGQFDIPFSIAIDPSDGAVYVQEVDTGNYRVDKYTAEGQFEWMIGKEVNATTKANICTAASKNVCQRGIQSTPGSIEEAAFKFENLRGDLLTVGGPAKLLYVADEQRVQEFDAEGTFKGEIPAGAIDSELACSAVSPGCQVTALAVDAIGNVYLSDNAPVQQGRIRVFSPNPAVKEMSFAVVPSEETPDAEVTVNGIALNPQGLLAVSAFESDFAGARANGLLYETGLNIGRLLTKFALPSVSSGLTFDGSTNSSEDPLGGYMYATIGEEVVQYKPVPVAELLAGGLKCEPGITQETDVTLDCLLTGTVNSEGVGNTEVLFEWGRTAALGEKTEIQLIPPVVGPVEVTAKVPTVRPNETGFDFRLAAYDDNNKSPEEALRSPEVSVTTPIVAPAIVGGLETLFVKSSSAVLTGEVNPENANTKYFFEYGPGGTLANCAAGVTKASCPGVAITTVLESSVYGKIKTNLEAKGLQPGTQYHYRMFAESENSAKTEHQYSIGPEAGFATEAAPKVQAVTGPPNTVTATSATVSGAVNPDGQPATYKFELGVYAGPTTQYGVVFSGLTGAGTTPVEKTLALTGLQPATTYAYRIQIASGYGNATGQPETFTTTVLPAVVQNPVPVVMLTVPKIAFPGKPNPAKCKHGLVRDKHGKCVKSKKKKTKHPKRGTPKKKK